MVQRGTRIFLLFVFLSLWREAYAEPEWRSHLNEEADRPNIILILTDDMDSALVSFMPNLKRLMIDPGTTFTNYFVNVPNCCPSRASLLRGQHAHNTGILGNTPPNGGFVKFRDKGLEKSTIATWLQDSGYYTVFLGKYLNGYPGGDNSYVPPGWNEWYGILRGLYFGIQLNENGSVVNYGNQAADYETDVLSRKVMDFIQRVPATTPFFVYLAPHAPHSSTDRSPSIPAPRHQNLFNNLSLPRVPSFNEADVSDKPREIRNLALMSAAEINTAESWYRARARSMVAVDEMIADIIETLTEKDLLRKTYIFFASDNGFHLGEHRIRVGKNTPYDESTNVPLIVRGPDVCIGRETTRFAQNIDLAPTFAEIAGVRPPGFVDGQSLLAILRNVGVSPNWKQDALIEHWTDRDSIQNPNFLALRSRQYLYVEHKTNELELYDLELDPFQVESIHDSVDQELLRQLSNRLHILANSNRIAGKQRKQLQ